MTNSPVVHRWSGNCATLLIVVLFSACDSDSPPMATTDEAATDEATGNDGSSTAALTCDGIATGFVARGTANAELPDPQIGATWVDDNVIVTSNQISDFPYIETSPGNPTENDLEFITPATPIIAHAVSDIPAHGAIGVAINVIPVFGAGRYWGRCIIACWRFYGMWRTH